MTGTKTKICSKCGIEKAFNCFNKDKSKKDGLRSQCKNCIKEYREQNKEKILRTKKEYREANKDEIKECQKEYYEQNKEKILRTKKEYREQNKEKILRTKKEYREQNKEKIKEYQKEYLQTERGKVVHKLKGQRRRAMKKHLPNTLTKEEWAETLEHFNHSCANCGSNETPIHIDHFVPLSSGEKGTTVTNCIPLCSTCNCSKGSKHPLDFFSKEKARKIIDYLYTRKSQEPI